jgi:hypothetical protein
MLQNKWYCNSFQQTCDYIPCHYCKNIEEGINCPLKKIVQKLLTKKRPNTSGKNISKKFIEK